LLAMIPLALVIAAFALLAKDSPGNTRGQPFRSYLRALKVDDMWWFCLLYSVTFGGYVGLGSFMPTFFHDQYGLDAINAGYLTALAAFIGSGLRPVGGWLADTFGGVRMLTILLLGISATYGLGAQLPSLGVMATLLFILSFCHFDQALQKSCCRDYNEVFRMVSRRKTPPCLAPLISRAMQSLTTTTEVRKHIRVRSYWLGMAACVPTPAWR